MNRPDISLTLRVTGDALDIAEVTSILGCSPTDARQKGDEVKSSHFVRHARTGVWRLTTECPDGDIDSAVAQLLGKLTVDTDAWANLASRLRIELFCGIVLRSANQGFSLHPATLKELTDRSITLSLDIYGCDDSPPPSP